MQSDLSFSPSPKSKRTPLIPRTIVEILDRTFRIYRNNFIQIMAITALMMIPLMLFTQFIGEPYREIEVNSRLGRRVVIPAGYYVYLMGSLLLQFAVGILLNSIIVYIAAENHLGRKPSLGEAFSTVWSRLFTVAGGSFLFGFLIGVSAFAIGVIGALCFIPLLALPVVMYLAIAGYFFITPVLVLEGVGVNLGISRALWLGKALFWRTFGLYVLVYIIMLFIGVLLGVFGQLLPGANTQTISTSTNVAQLTVEIIAIVLTTPVLPIALTLMYFDTRIRLEGLDIAFEALDTPEPRVEDVASPMPTASLVSGKDLTNVLIFTVGAIVLSFAFGAAIMAFVGQFIGR